MGDHELYEHFKEFISEERAALFDRIVQDRTRHVTVVLEEIYQSQNASAVLRTCDLTGIQDVHIIEDRNKYTLNKDVSLGSSKWVDIYRYHQPDKKETTLKSCVHALREKGYRIVATSPLTKDSVSVNEINLDAPIAIMFGTELEGLTEQALALSDQRMYVPMYGFTESFNISVCAAITLYTLVHRMRNASQNYRLNEAQQLQLKLHWARKMLRKSEAIEQRFKEEKNR